MLRSSSMGVVFALLLSLGSSLETAAAARWVWPANGDLLTAYRYAGKPYAGGQHRGIDIAANMGAPVVAATAGTVRFVGVAGSSGLTVSLRSADGRFDTSYLHLAATVVEVGEHVAAGDRVGSVGDSGSRSAAAAHLHFGVREAGAAHGYRDPLDFLPPPASVLDVPHVGPPPRPVHPPPLRPFARIPAARPQPVGSGLDLGWATACLALLLVAGLTGAAARTRARRRDRSSIGLRAVLRNDADLLRQR
jgi:murein DD-endopeptidase MepM/ murein hydrolase activator NlpD